MNDTQPQIIIEQMLVPEDRFLSLWGTISNFRLPFGTEYLRYKYGWTTGFALRTIDEYRRFAFLALTSKHEITPSLCVDEVWHCHILHTESYEEFSQLVGRTLHHFPGMPDEEARWSSQYERTLSLYRGVFGEEPPMKQWPRQEERII